MQVLRHYHNFVGPNCCFIFMDQQGRGFSNPTLSTHWVKWLEQETGSRMPPSQCRQVFVDERRSDSRVEGPSDAGAAHIMGHSVTQWDKWYDQQFYIRQGQNAVNAMDKWRQNLLREAGFQEPETPVCQEEPVTVRTIEEEDSFHSCAGSLNGAVEEDVVIEEDLVIELE
jgi:hypothetical protein